jgi:hypothetical protein
MRFRHRPKQLKKKLIVIEQTLIYKGPLSLVKYVYKDLLSPQPVRVTTAKSLLIFRHFCDVTHSYGAITLLTCTADSKTRCTRSCTSATYKQKIMLS